jgi:hypothetical protein
MNEARTLHPALVRYRDGPPSNPRSYPDLHEHVLALACEKLLVVVDEPMNKDTEMHPLVRWQYRGGIPEPERKTFLFTQPTDSKGRRFDCSDRGMDAILAIGRRSSSVKRGWWGRAIILRLAWSLQSSGAARCHEYVGRATCWRKK